MKIPPKREVIEINVKTDGILSFTIRDASPGRPWWWDLDLNGEQLYRISNGCDTCNALFRRDRDAALPISPENLSKMLGEGIHFIEKKVIETVSFLLPKGTYLVGLLRLKPRALKRGRKPGYVTVPEFGWICKKKKYKGQVRYEAVLPIVSEHALDQARIKHYESKIRSGEEPTALALSILLEKNIMGTFLQWGLSHILLDGHHKMMAASNTSKPLTVLSFLYTGPTRPSLTLGPGEEDIRRYYSGEKLRLGWLGK